MNETSSGEMLKNDVLNEIRKKKPNRIIIAHLNMNSIRNKLEMLKEIMDNKTDILLKNLDYTFPFILDGFTPPHRLDRTAHGGGLVLFVRKDIPSKLLPTVIPSGNIENLFLAINLRSKKWLISGFYNPNVGLIQNHTVNLSKNFGFYSSKYENFIVIGDFNAQMTNNYLEEFCTSYNLKDLIKQPTYSKNVENSTCIDLILTNHTKSFHSSSVCLTSIN